MQFTWFLTVYYYLLDGSYPKGASKVLKQKIRRHASRLVIQGESLFEKSSGKEILHEATIRDRLVQIHKEGHLGPKKLFKKVQEHFVYWNGNLEKACKLICNECVTCQMRARSTFNRFNKARPIPTPGKFNHTWGVDAVGPLPISPNKNRYILTGIEFLSRYPVALAVPDITEETTTDFYLTQIIYHFGVSQYYLSDRGSNFKSTYTREFLKQLGCKPIHGTSFRAQSNGMVERLNQTLCRTLAKLARDKDDLENWDKYVGPALMVLRGMENESTGFSPAYLLFGQSMITPGLWLAPIKGYVEGDYETDVANRVKWVETKLKEIREEARVRSDKKKLTYANRYNATVHFRKPFEIGEQVLLKQFVIDGKFSDKWCGPFVIAERKGDDIYYLSGSRSTKIKYSVNGDALKPFVESKSMLPDVNISAAHSQFRTWVATNTGRRL